MTRNPLYGIYGDLARGDHPVAKSPDSGKTIKFIIKLAVTISYQSLKMTATCRHCYLSENRFLNSKFQAEFTRSDECQTTRPGGQLGPDNSAHVETTRPRVLRQPGPPRDNSARSPETTCWTSVVF
ncbi:uncharacterized protein LOC121392085 isoform X1 [Gigantopelta aegis]|uniref:uncharacterized protein LOC121392085 isoform X1 n=1 Tax=Gigantopelta aegis TaxID=1735272 RepID=UPI001B88C9F1|nr:uncharacterized protein LOC121392085 isoform X1 [Gigantopelta aegis]